MKNKELIKRAQEYVEEQGLTVSIDQTEKAFRDGYKAAEKEIKLKPSNGGERWKQNKRK